MLYKKEPLVLIVAKDKKTESLSRALKLERVSNVVFVSSGIEALKYAKNRMPELLLLPYDADEGVGSSTCKLIKTMPSGESCMVIMLLDFSEPKTINEAYSMGADGFESKLTPKRILAKKLRYYLRSRRSIAGFYELENIIDELGVMAQIGFWQWQPQSNEFYASPTVAHIYKASKRHFRAFNEFLGIHSNQNSRSDLYEAVESVREDGISRSVELEHNIGGKTFFIHHQIKAHGLFSDQNFRITGHIRDISNRRIREQQRTETFLYDELTELPSENFLKQHLTKQIQRSKQTDTFFSVLVINIDGFSRVNDAFGFSTGDELLVRVAKRLKTLCDKPEKSAEPHFIAKLSADEFSIVMDSMTAPDATTYFVQSIQQCLSNSFKVEDLNLNVTASIGIAVYPLDSQSEEELLACAMTALKHAKRKGRNNYQYFVQSLNQESIKRLGLESDLRSALHNDELSLYYQPKVNLKTQKVESAEALLRWCHPKLGMVSPDEFISLAEDIGLMRELGAWVLEAGCSQVKRWVDKGYQIHVALNVSSSQLYSPVKFIEEFQQILDKCQLPPNYIELELTESIFLENSNLYGDLFKDLKNMGVKMAIDDFGTGYSSLSYLMNLNADTLKIDRSFIQSVSENYQQSQVVQSIIDLAKKIDMSVVAEGVSSKVEEEFLLDAECDEAQGYFYSPALPADEFEEWMLAFNQK